MNCCRYCKSPWIRVESGWKVCDCSAAQEDYKMSVKIQSLEKEINDSKFALKKFRELYSK